jgi:hypothetical protein
VSRDSRWTRQVEWHNYSTATLMFSPEHIVNVNQPSSSNF